MTARWRWQRPSSLVVNDDDDDDNHDGDGDRDEDVKGAGDWGLNLMAWYKVGLRIAVSTLTMTQANVFFSGGMKHNEGSLNSTVINA